MSTPRIQEVAIEKPGMVFVALYFYTNGSGRKQVFSGASLTAAKDAVSDLTGIAGELGIEVEEKRVRVFEVTL